MLVSIVSLICFALVLCLPTATVIGASQGLLLWYRTVLPTLLPTMILSDFLIRTGAHQILISMLQRPLSLLFGTSSGGSYAVLIGMLCGYPMGAKTAVSLFKEQMITQREASYLLSFTNQPSPMFLIGYLCLGLFQNIILPQNTSDVSHILLTTSGIHLFIAVTSIYGSALLVSVCHRTISHVLGHPFAFRKEVIPLTRNKTTDFSPLSLLEASMMTSVEVMVKIGGYLMLFSIVEQWILLLPAIPHPLRVLIMGMIEMTSGLGYIVQGISFPWSFALCIGLCAFGGLSGYAQTANLIQGSGLSASQYLLWKILQGILATILAVLWIFFLGYVPNLT